MSCVPAHHPPVPRAERVAAELRLGLVYQQCGLHRHAAHHASHPTDQRQHPLALSGPCAILRLLKVPYTTGVLTTRDVMRFQRQAVCVST